MASTQKKKPKVEIFYLARITKNCRSLLGVEYISETSTDIKFKVVDPSVLIKSPFCIPKLALLLDKKSKGIVPIAEWYKPSGTVKTLFDRLSIKTTI
jgi:hypothetical protein